jgi:hypothetical protein
MSPGTGSIRSPIVHSPFVPALPPMGGRPPTSTTWNTSTSSCTRPERARAIAVERLNRASLSREGGGGDDVLLGMLEDMCSFAAEMLRLRDASVSRRIRSLSRSCGTSDIPMDCAGKGTHCARSPSSASQARPAAPPLVVRTHSDSREIVCQVPSSPRAPSWLSPHAHLDLQHSAAFVVRDRGC